jgi:hypothetical protein
MIKSPFHPAGLIGFGLASSFSVVQKWSLQEFCWSTWLAGLVFSWTCVAIAAAQILLTAGTERSRYEKKFAFLRKVPPLAGHAAIFLTGALIGCAALILYTYLFGFYGLFLSVYAEMEPHSLFGRNGFINSDFFTPVVYLTRELWPMALGTLIASVPDLLRGDPWKRVLLPIQSEVIRMHVMVVALPFLTLLAWALFGTNYQPVTIVLLIALFFLLTKRGRKGGGETTQELPRAE